MPSAAISRCYLGGFFISWCLHVASLRLGQRLQLVQPKGFFSNVQTFLADAIYASGEVSEAVVLLFFHQASAVPVSSISETLNPGFTVMPRQNSVVVENVFGTMGNR